jgi:predicted nucleic acid-binding protein
VTAYFDTSAVVKLVIRERGSTEALEVWEAAGTAVSSVLMYPEARAALKKARRERRLTDAQLRLAVTAFGALWQQVDRVVVSASLATRAGVLAHEYDLRGYDSVHLASAEMVAEPRLVFVAADADLCAAAQRLGLAVAAVPR